ncbi:MAG: thiolase domain-containing protein, partial [Actinokineospora sp.]
MRNVAIVGAGQTHHARRRTDVTQVGLAREAAVRALEDADLTIDDIDSIVVCTGPVLFAAVNQPEKWLADALGARLKPVVRVTSGGGTGLAGALSALNQIAGGAAERVLVVAYDKLSEGALQYSISTLYDPFWGREFAVGIMGFSA